MMERVTTGLPELDKLLGGGLPKNTVVLLSGGPGTGKTLLSLNFMVDGAQGGDRCCYLTLNEDEKGLLRACTLEKLSPIHKHLNKNLVVEPLEMGGDIDLEYFKHIFNSYPQTDRLVIDNLNKLLIYAESKREYRIALSTTVKYLRNNVGSTLLVCETEENKIDTGNGEAFECDGVLHLSFLELEEKPKRTLEIHKMRYTGFDPKVQHEFIVNDQGLKLTKTKII
jgi:circadian clock protein KaiC